MDPREAVVLGVDPGLTATGICALGDRTCAWETSTKPQQQGETARLISLMDLAAEWTREYRPCVVLIEEQRGMVGWAAVQEKVYAALCMGMVRQAGYCEPEPLLLSIAPGTVKKYLCGTGRAKTEEVVAEIRKRWGGPQHPLADCSEDATMAYGIARIALEVAGGTCTAAVREIA